MSFYGAKALAYEEPDYAVVESTDSYELRPYDPYIVAEVDVPGTLSESGNKAFRILAGYIFGDNRPQQKMNMTVPVESVETGTKMNMTVPVESKNNSESGYTYSFVMERAYTMETLPAPVDPRIRLVERPSRYMAVKRYSGSTSHSRYKKEEAKLLAALAADDVALVGEPRFARYNGPFTPWFMRRNEVMVEVAFTTQD